MLALIVGAVLIIIGDEGVKAAVGYFCAAPMDTVTAASSAVGEAYKALAVGALGGIDPDQRIVDPGNAADLRRPGGLAGVPRRSVQHRCPGPADHGRDLRRLRRVRLASAARPAPDRGDHRRSARRRALGRCRRPAEGPDRRARGDRDDHAQLRRDLPARLAAHHHGLPAARPDRPDLPIVDHNAQYPQFGRHPAARAASSSRCSPRSSSGGCSTAPPSASSCAPSAPTRTPPGPRACRWPRVHPRDGPGRRAGRSGRHRSRCWAPTCR